MTEVRNREYEGTSDKERLITGLEDIMLRAPLDGADLDAAIAEYRPDLLIVDINANGALTRAEASGLPWVLAMPSLLPLREPGIPPYSLGLKPANGPLGRVRDGLLWPMVERAFGKSLLPWLNPLRKTSGLPPLRSQLDLWAEPNLVLGLTGSPLEYPRHRLPGNVALVGSQPWDPPAEAPAYLAEPGDPWVLVTCSTDYQGDESLARAAVEALRNEPYRVVLTLADAYDGADLPAADNVVATRFVSHAAVLPRAAAVVTHAGMGIVGKATYAGVPIVAVPFGRDQPEIARRIVEAGTGVRLPARQLTPERLRAAVRAAVACQPRAQAVADELRQTEPAVACADAISALLEPEERRLTPEDDPRTTLLRFDKNERDSGRFRARGCARNAARARAARP